MNNRKRISICFIMSWLASIIGCATSQPYLINDVAQKVIMRSSDYHQFTYVRIYEDDGELVVYGKVRHDHEFCEQEGHVDLASVDKNGQVIYAKSLPLRVQSKKVYGWHGAGFRTRFASKGGCETLHLAFHDQHCHKAGSYACGDNQAKPH